MFSEPIYYDAAPLPQASFEAPPRTICLAICVCVALDFGIDPRTLLASGRGAPRLAQARQIAMYLAHVGFALSCETVARHFHRDRSTVAHACRVVEDGRDDRWFDCRVSALELVCRGAVIDAELLLRAQGPSR